MALCHFDQMVSPTPVAVLTKLDGTILAANTPVQLGSKYQAWIVSGVRAMITRFWASSSASIVLTCHVPSIFMSPPAFPNELGIEREFCIWLGYLDRIREVTTEDLTVGRLVRVFTGIVDNVKATGSAKGGYTIQISARDRMKWFMDSEVYFSTVELARLYSKEFQASGGGIPRSTLIYDVCRRAIGASPLTTTTGVPDPAYQSFKGKGITADTTNWFDIGLTNTLQVDPYVFYSSDMLNGQILTSLGVAEDPSLRIVTTRIPIGGAGDPQGDGVTFLLNGQVPVDVIKSIAFQEVYPTEFFADARDGNLYYSPRGYDSTGLKDPKRFYRSYFFRVQDKQKASDLYSSNCQDLIALRDEVSSIGLKTNFFVSVSSPLSTLAPHSDYVIHLATNPYALRNVKYAPKYHRINDPTIKSIEEAAVVALSSARIWGKESNVAMSVMLGDPSLTPGEVIQVFGSPLVKNGGLDEWGSDREKFYEWESSSKAMIQGFAQFAQDGGEAGRQNKVSTTQGNAYIQKNLEGNYEAKYYDDSLVTFKTSLGKKDEGWFSWIKNIGKSNPTTIAGQPIIGNIEELLSTARSTHVPTSDKNATGFEELPRTIYRIEACHHKFNLGSPGFTTEVALVSPF